MEFALSHEQILFADSLRGTLAQQASLDSLRTLANSEPGFSERLWQVLVELGVPGLLVPEAHGGAELSTLDAAIAAQVLGEAVAPVPYIGTVVMATLALLQSGKVDQQQEWLPRIASGKVRVGVGVVELAGQVGVCQATLNNGLLSGRIEGAIDAAGATHLLVYLADGRAAWVDAGDRRVSIRLRRSLDATRPLADLKFEGVHAESLDAANEPLDAALKVLCAGRVALAADTLGAAQTMLNKAVAWAKQRVQFGRLIGSFQGVKYMCADMATMLEPCHAFVWHAAHAQDALPEEARIMACQVKAHLDDVGRHVARVATEVHGGMGVTDFLGLHFWLKRIAFNRQVLGGPERCRHEAAMAQGWIAA